MHWGLKIIAAYLVFMAVLFVLAFKSFNSPVDLVAEDYYRQEIAYQSRIDRIQNEKALAQSVEILNDARGQTLKFTFPQMNAPITGTIKLYRPADASLDRAWTIELDDQNRQLLSTRELSRGLWSIQIEWESGDRGYFKEKKIYMQ